MSRPVDPPPKAGSLNSRIVLDRVRATVVRRRVYEVPLVVSVPSADAADREAYDESGPPSSVNVARALASLRGDELQRLDAIMRAQDEQEERERASAIEPSAPSVRAGPSIPTLYLGPTITLVELARRMGVSGQELVTALVTGGFFSVTVRTTLPRDTARAAATMFGWRVEDDDAPAIAHLSTKRPATGKASPRSAKAKTKAARGASKKVPVPRPKVTGGRRRKA